MVFRCRLKYLLPTNNPQITNTWCGSSPEISSELRKMPNHARFSKSFRDIDAFHLAVISNEKLSIRKRQRRPVLGRASDSCSNAFTVCAGFTATESKEPSVN